ncbi:hypothetical protein A374_05281 [Fictibacillus macauensis ZFHKF-1]|uniref:Integral inner membrane protein n=1 Tax=Fictibacillus macauensis ZFHKF-1 TaxID=1196324 RepID=I8UHG4_9BACL|nr:DUF2512 family protein [Fictibacillus macauensis]EIT86350.1 hypothetical protein A374_05281 [Fictibacillus macauensis ZFHKF-1]
MQSLLLKIVCIPLILLLCTFWFESVTFNQPLPFLIITIILAPISVVMEYILIPRIARWVITVLDWILAFLLVYIVSSLMTGAFVTLFGAFLIALFYTIVEWLIHKQLASQQLNHSYS